MVDMLVKLYDLPGPTIGKRLLAEGIVVCLALAADRKNILAFIEKEFPNTSVSWTDECVVALSKCPTTCYIAIQNSNIIGFACYDAIARNFLGPMGVAAKYRGMGIGTTLMLYSMQAMENDGYGYCILGWVFSTEFFDASRVSNSLIHIQCSFRVLITRSVFALPFGLLYDVKV